MKIRMSEFTNRCGTGIMGILGASALLTFGLSSCATDEKQPNIILIMADDMGISDIGSYGSEINTPNLDRLAENGVRFSQFYNGARCCPTRASLLTGLYAHQTGVGHMTSNFGHDSYRGELNYRGVTIAEALGNSGYATFMSGKWHVTDQMGYWTGNENQKSKHNWPIQRGFDRFFGTILGAGSYFDPITLVKGNEPAEPGYENFYYTDAINDHAVRFIEEHAGSGDDKPFFAYVSHVAPHWPLHAFPEDIARYRGRYDEGWDKLREERLNKMKEIGFIEDHFELTPRDPRVPAWEEEEHQEWMKRAMEVYAAQVDNMDQGIGRIIETLEKNDMLDNTLIVFLSDNGGCAEVLTDRWRGLFIPESTRDGRPVKLGNNPDYLPGPEETYQSYGVGWANASNTPYKLYKSFAHEGGVISPLIMHWPEGIKKYRNEWRRYPSHIIDLMPTFLDIAGAGYPERFNGEDILPLEGRSLMPYISDDKTEREDALFWEHQGNRAIRDGRWKLVQRHNQQWELYDILTDRSELNDLSGEIPEKVKELKEKYEAWAERVGALPWPVRDHI